jgi:RPA family protein
MGLNIFDRLYTQASEDIKEVNTLLKDFKKSDYGSELASITNDLIMLTSKQKDFKKDERILKNSIKEIISEIKEETKRLKPVDDSLRDIDDLKTDETKLRGMFGNVDLKLDELQVEEYDLQRAIEDISKKMSSYKQDGVQDKYFELEKLEEEREYFSN